MKYYTHLDRCQCEQVFNNDRPHRRRTFLVGAAALFGLVAAAFPALAQTPTKVVATTSQVADLVRNVVGDVASVTGLLGEGVDPHLYKLTRSDIGQLTQADIIFYNGLLLEGKMTDALIRIASSGKPVVAVTEKLGDEFLLAPEGFEGQFDPHVWMDVTAWMRAVEVVRDRMAEFRPAAAERFNANAAQYLQQLKALDAYARQTLAQVPEPSRVLITAHDAFNYFGRAYGFDVIGIQGISTESEAGLRRIEELVKLLVDRKISAVFVETTVSDRNVRALIEGAKARGHVVRIGGELYSDAMGPPGTYEGTYIGMIDHNVTTIARALGGNAERGGFNGRLTKVAH